VRTKLDLYVFISPLVNVGSKLYSFANKAIAM